MDIGAMSTRIDSHIDSLVTDCPDVISKIVQLGYDRDTEVIELVTVLPSALDISVNIGMVQRWRDISKYFGRPVRIYGWSYNTAVEKCFLSLVQEKADIFLTVLPGELRGEKKHA